MIAIEVISAVIGLVTGIAAIYFALKTIADATTKFIMQLTFKQVMKAIGQIIAQMIGQIVSSLGAIIQARSMTNASVIEATRKAQDDYQTSDAHGQVTTNQAAQIKALNDQFSFRSNQFFYVCSETAKHQHGG